MNSEERHNLQKNELEEVIEEMPEILKKHWLSIAGVVLLVIVALVSWTAVKHSVQKNKKESNQALARILTSRSEAQLASANDNANYNTAAVASSLATYASSSSNSARGYNAELQQANTIMSELYFTQNYLTQEAKSEIYAKATKIYESTASKYSKYPMAVGLSNIGLASVALEQRDWDKAESIYNSILADSDKYQGTPIVVMAQSALKQMEKLKEIDAIEFAPAPIEEPSTTDEPAIKIPTVNELITQPEATATEAE